MSVLCSCLFVWKQNVLPLSAQLKYFMHYKVKMRRLLGVKSAEDIIGNAIFVISMGTNDFLQNYYLDPIRPNQYTIDQFQNFLVSRMAHSITVLVLAIFSLSDKQQSHPVIFTRTYYTIR